MKEALVKELLNDMGFDPYSDTPGWAYTLAEYIIDEGWRKEKK